MKGSGGTQDYKRVENTVLDYLRKAEQYHKKDKDVCVRRMRGDCDGVPHTATKHTVRIKERPGEDTRGGQDQTGPLVRA